MDQPIYSGLAVLDLSKLLMYETYYDKSQPYVHRKKLQLYYMDTDSLVLSISAQDKIKVLKKIGMIYLISVI